MIIWAGKGFLIAVMVFVFSLLGELSIEALTRNDRYYQTHTWPLTLVLLAAAAVCWGWAKRQKPESQDSLFFIPLRYWGPILAALSLTWFFLGGH